MDRRIFEVIYLIVSMILSIAFLTLIFSNDFIAIIFVGISAVYIGHKIGTWIYSKCDWVYEKLFGGKKINDN